MEMKRDIEKVDKIKRLMEAGLSDKEIQDILDLAHTVQRVLNESERQKDTMTANEVAEEIKKQLEGKVKGSWDVQKVRRLRRNGILVAVDEDAPKKDGFRFSKHVIDNFIKDQLSTREALIAKRDQYFNLYVDETMKLGELKYKMQQEIDGLKKENERLQNLLGKSSLEQKVEKTANENKESEELLPSVEES